MAENKVRNALEPYKHKKELSEWDPGSIRVKTLFLFIKMRELRKYKIAHCSSWYISNKQEWLILKYNLSILISYSTVSANKRLAVKVLALDKWLVE